MGRLNPGRLAAVRVLVSVERGHHAEDLLADLAPPDAADRGLAWHLSLGVLRRRGTLDAALAPLVSRPLASLDPAALAALRVGLFEIALSRTPLHAAVDQAVEACRAAGAPRAAGFVNAVLRRAARIPLPDDIWMDLPDWLSERWADYGPWVAQMRDPAPLCGVLRTPGATPEGLETAPATAGGEPVQDAFVVLHPQGPVDRLAGFAEGAWWVMDPSSARIADLAWEAAGQATPRVLDACAAPGGKTLRLAARGALVVACDGAADRLARVEEGRARVGLEGIELRHHDWLEGPIEGLEPCDVVLVDAPCSGLGTVRRHPEIRWLRRPSDPAAMALRQLPILRAAATHVAPGGALVYAVCSPMREEGEGVVTQLDGWTVERQWASVPPSGDEDAFQGFVLRRR